MPVTNIRGVDINYEILGERGPFIALQPGGRRALNVVKPLGAKIAEAGYRVIVYDRRNCGASSIAIEGESENEEWAEDLHELLAGLDALPAYIGGSSSGCRLAMILALRRPEDVRGLLLWRVTGGAFAAERLTNQYYTSHIEAAEKGGMAAVCGLEHWSEVIAANPASRRRADGNGAAGLHRPHDALAPQLPGGSGSSGDRPQPCRAARDDDAGLHRAGLGPGASAHGRPGRASPHAEC